MDNYTIIEIDNETIDLLQPLANESATEGDEFIQRTINEWKSGKNRFSKPSEKFWGIVVDSELVGVGGLNQDPFVEDEHTGRVRHVYILQKYRGKGLSKILLNIIIDRAKQYFTSLRLSTHNPIAASLYESLGFQKTDERKATHRMSFK